MPESSTNVEAKGRRDNLKRKNNAYQNEHIEANVTFLMAPLTSKLNYKS